MNIKKIAVFLIILVICGMAISARAAEEDTRYFVKTNAAFWKKSFNARHVFNNGFTADLTDWQLRLAKLFGVEVESVKKFNILEDSLLAKAPKPTPIKQVPSDSIPWGIKMVYNDDSLDKTSGGVDINVAVLDTGVSIHLDLKDRIKECKDFTNP
jgi:subtilisin